MRAIRLVEVFGDLCLEPDRAVEIQTRLDSEHEGGRLELSLEGIRSLGPSFATALLLVLEDYKASHPGITVRMTHLTRRHAQTIEESKRALRSHERTEP